MNNENRIIEITEIINDLVIEANIIANVTSAADKGLQLNQQYFPSPFPLEVMRMNEKKLAE